MPDRLVRAAYASPDRVQRAWRTASVTGRWTFPGDWWVPAVDAVSEALAQAGAIDAACAELGRSRAAVGVGLDETLDDIESLGALLDDDVLAGDPVLARMVRAVALGWAETTCEILGSTTCEDPLSLLSTPAYLRTRLGELYREAERTQADLGRTHALVLVALPETREWDAMTRPLHVGESLRAVFSGGETLSALSASRTVAVVARDAHLPDRLDALRRLLGERLGSGPGAPEPIRVWVERLPPTPGAAHRLVSELRR